MHMDHTCAVAHMHRPPFRAHHTHTHHSPSSVSRCCAQCFVQPTKPGSKYAFASRESHIVVVEVDSNCLGRLFLWEGTKEELFPTGRYSALANPAIVKLSFPMKNISSRRVTVCPLTTVCGTFFFNIWPSPF